MRSIFSRHSTPIEALRVCIVRRDESSRSDQGQNGSLCSPTMSRFALHYPSEKNRPAYRPADDSHRFTRLRDDSLRSIPQDGSLRSTRQDESPRHMAYRPADDSSRRRFAPQKIRGKRYSKCPPNPSLISPRTGPAGRSPRSRIARRFAPQDDSLRQPIRTADCWGRASGSEVSSGPLHLRQHHRYHHTPLVTTDTTNMGPCGSVAYRGCCGSESAA